MKKFDLKRVIGAVSLVAFMLASMPFTAMAAEAKQLKTESYIFDMDGYIGQDSEKFVGTSTPHDGIDSYNEKFLSEYAFDWDESNWLSNFIHVSEGSSLNISVSGDYKGETLYAYPRVFALDDDGHIAYTVDTCATDEELSTVPKTVFQFNNVAPMKLLQGANNLMQDMEGTVAPEKLVFTVEIFKGLENQERIAIYSFIIKNDAGSGQSTTTKPTDTTKVSTATAVPTNSKVQINGKEVAFDAYMINGNNYFKLRDLASVLSASSKQFDVMWDNDKQAINLLSGKAYTVVGGELAKGDNSSKTATLNTSKVYLDGKEINLTAYTIGGNNYFKLRNLGQTFNFGVSWDGAANTVTIDTSTSYTAE